MQVDACHRASMEAFLLKTFLLVLVIVAERKKQLLGMSRLQGPQHQPSEDSRPWSHVPVYIICFLATESCWKTRFKPFHFIVLLRAQEAFFLLNIKTHYGLPLKDFCIRTYRFHGSFLQQPWDFQTQSLQGFGYFGRQKTSWASTWLRVWLASGTPNASWRLP